MLAPFVEAMPSLTVTTSNTSPDAVVTITVNKDEATFGDPLSIFSSADLSAETTMRIEN